LSNVVGRRIVEPSEKADRFAGSRGGGLRTGRRPTMEAYVLVQTETRRHQIAEELRGISGIVFAEDVTGPYDALALARHDPGADDLQGTLEQIRQLPGVIHALAAPLAGATPEGALVTTRAA
jgi:hypothetical protein